MSARTVSTVWPVCFFFQAEDGIRDLYVTGVQTCALPIWRHRGPDAPLPLAETDSGTGAAIVVREARVIRAQHLSVERDAAPRSRIHGDADTLGVARAGLHGAGDALRARDGRRATHDRAAAPRGAAAAAAARLAAAARVAAAARAARVAVRSGRSRRPRL